MPLGVEIGLGPGHIVLDGDPAPLPKKGTAPTFGPCLLWPNGWMEQDVTSCEGTPRPGPQCVRYGDPAPPHKKGAQNPNMFVFAVRMRSC